MDPYRTPSPPPPRKKYTWWQKVKCAFGKHPEFFWFGTYGLIETRQIWPWKEEGRHVRCKCCAVDGVIDEEGYIYWADGERRFRPLEPGLVIRLE